MEHLDPGPEPSHKLERANSCLRQGRQADSLEHRLMHQSGVSWKGKEEHPLALGPVLYIDTAVDREVFGPSRAGSPQGNVLS